MTNEAHVFFARYRDSFSTFDEAMISSFFGYPNMIVDVNGTRVTDNACDMRLLLSERLRLYRQKGVTEPRILNLIQTEPSPWLIQAAVTWGLYGGNGEAIVRFSTTYTLKQIGGAWKIVFVVAHNEPQAFEEANREICYIGDTPSA